MWNIQHNFENSINNIFIYTYLLFLIYVERWEDLFWFISYFLPWETYFMLTLPTKSNIYICSLVSKIVSSIYFIPYCCYFLMSYLYWQILSNFLHFIWNNHVPANDILDKEHLGVVWYTELIGKYNIYKQTQYTSIYVILIYFSK